MSYDSALIYPASLLISGSRQVTLAKNRAEIKPLFIKVWGCLFVLLISCFHA